MNEHEGTFDDVIVGIKMASKSIRKSLPPISSMLDSLANELKAAHDREMAAKDEMNRIVAQSAQARFDEKIAEKDAEIARIEAALKPVLECRIERIDGLDSPNGEFMTSSEYGVCDADGNEVDNHSIASALNAVREAQRIYNEGGAK